MAAADILAYFLSKYFNYEERDYFENVFELMNVTTNLDVGSIPKGITFSSVVIHHNGNNSQNVFESIEVDAYITVEEFDKCGLNKEDFPGLTETTQEGENEDTGELENVPYYIIDLTKYFNFELTIKSKDKHEKLQ